MNSLFDDSIEKIEEHNVTPANLDSVGEPKPTRQSTTSLRKEFQKQQAFDTEEPTRNVKNVTINSDLNETYQITPNETQYVTADDDDVDSGETPVSKPMRTQPAIVYNVEIDDQSSTFLRDLQNKKENLRTPTPNFENIQTEQHPFEAHQFNHHVETKEAGDTERTSPNYIDDGLVETKDNMRDINQIPNITVDSPSPELPDLKPVPKNNDSLTFPPPPTEAEQAKMSLRPFSEDIETLGCNHLHQRPIFKNTCKKPL